jgi:hypothetical protein
MDPFHWPKTIEMQLLVGTQTANLTIFGDYDVLLH